eukprot:TRINITY_DN12199_c0_g1_i1.p1 TRINITY_DN12199_c0_g1~~TRINITY_DN12199_c0_g1_i1.p1  ORF type:complete len:1767 (-),score=200.25 TRINITY_DN12199_c0_g1_i1:119-5263(-)
MGKLVLVAVLLLLVAFVSAATVMRDKDLQGVVNICQKAQHLPAGWKCGSEASACGSDTQNPWPGLLCASRFFTTNPVGSFYVVIGVDFSDFPIPSTFESHFFVDPFFFDFLEVLDLSHRQFSNTVSIPEDFPPAMQVLILSDCGLTGSLPQSWYDPGNSQMVVLDISENDLYGSLSQILKFQNLEVFRGSGNDFSETGDIDANSQSLVIFECEYCQLYDLEPFSFANFCEYLLDLNLRGNNFDSSSTPYFSDCVIEHLDLSNNDLAFMWQELFAALPLELKTLSCSGCNIQGNFPEDLLSIYALNSLDLSHNDMPFNFVDFSGLDNLNYLSLAHNNPNLKERHTVLAIPLNLVYLDLSYNEMLGSFPHDIFQAVSHPLEYIDLSHNQLDGEIVDGSGSYSNMGQLSYFDVSFNNFHGNFPEAEFSRYDAQPGSPFSTWDYANFESSGIASAAYTSCWPEDFSPFDCLASGLSFYCHCDPPSHCILTTDSCVYDCAKSGVSGCPNYDSGSTYCNIHDSTEPQCDTCPAGTVPVASYENGYTNYYDCGVSNCGLDTTLCAETYGNPPNSYCDGDAGVCNRCPDGYQSKPDYSDCELSDCSLATPNPCPESQICDQSQGVCATCADGYEPNQDRTECVQYDCNMWPDLCEVRADQICVNGRCELCERGYLDNGNNECELSDCSVSPDSCPAGTVCSESDGECVSCQDGYVPADNFNCTLFDCQLITEAERETECGSPYDQYCGDEKSQDGSRLCRDCDLGLSPSTDRLSCVVSNCTLDPQVCSETLSSFCNTETGLCETCAVGFESWRSRLGCEMGDCRVAGAAECMSSGQFCQQDYGLCLNCLQGYSPVADGTGCEITNCTLAGEGSCSRTQFCNSTSHLCEECGKGYVSSADGSSCNVDNCFDAGPTIACTQHSRHYCEASIGSKCADCPQGYLPDATRTSCVLANCAGLDPTNSIPSELRACPGVDKFCNRVTKECETCPVGTVGNSERKDCEVSNCVEARANGFDPSKICAGEREYCHFDTKNCETAPLGYSPNEDNNDIVLVDCELAGACQENEQNYCDTSTGQCALCPTGYRARGDSLGCVLDNCLEAGPVQACPDDESGFTYQCNALGICQVCPLGFTASDDRLECVLTACQEADNPEKECTSTPQEYCPIITAENSGTVSPGPCEQCPVGYIADAIRRNCLLDDCLLAGPTEACKDRHQCVERYVSALETTKNVCEECPPGYDVDESQTSCFLTNCTVAGPEITCNENERQYCLGAECSECSEGYRPHVSRSRCEVEDCSKTAEGVRACTLLDPNMYCSRTTQQCVACSVGFSVSDTYDKCVCDDCPEAGSPDGLRLAAQTLGFQGDSPEVGFIIVLVLLILLLIGCLVGGFVWWSIKYRKKGFLLAANTASIKTLPPQLRPLFDMKKALKEHWNKVGDHLFVKELSESDSEYTFMQKLFTEQMDGKDLPIAKAYSVLNGSLLSNFTGHRGVLATRIAQDPTLFQKNDWKSADREELRQYTLDTLSARTKSFEWFDSADDVPIIPLVHGTDAGIAMKIAENGFTTLSSLDAGYYGSGIYFTSSARYALPYYGGRKNPAVLICFSVPGNPYPVVEHRTEENSMLGMPLKSGYQSHYVLARKNGNPVKSQRGNFMDGVYDELVIGQESQVIPAWILEFDGDKLAKEAVAFARELPDERGNLLSTKRGMADGQEMEAVKYEGSSSGSISFNV